MTLYGVLVWPHPELMRFIRAFQRDHQLAGYGVPHINLRSPFFWQGSEEELKEKFQDLSRNLSPLTLSSCGWKRFPNVLYVSLESTPSFREAHQMCRTLGGEPFKPVDGVDYLPHITVGLGIVPWEEEAVWQLAQQTYIPHLTWSCSELILTKDVCGEFTIVDSAPLHAGVLVDH